MPVIRYEAGRIKGSTGKLVELCNRHGRNDVSSRSGLARWRKVSRRNVLLLLAVDVF